uniref:Uncharacterized protein n=1 Tax=Trichuris muris TaxID=70415 RepID=A0A5S6QMP1_TRIMR
MLNSRLESSFRRVERSDTLAKQPVDVTSTRRLSARSDAIETKQDMFALERNSSFRSEGGQTNLNAGSSASFDQADCDFDEVDVHLEKSFVGHEEGKVADAIKEFAEGMQASFAQLRNEFTRYGRILEADERNNGLMTLAHDSPNDVDWIKSLSLAEATELLEAETLKRRLCERKLALLQEHIISLEEQLELSRNVVSRQQASLNGLEIGLRRLTDQLKGFEENRGSFVRRTAGANKELLKRIQHLSEYCRISDQNLEIATERVTALEKLNSDLRDANGKQFVSKQMVEGDLETAKDECRRRTEEARLLKSENEDLRRELSRLHSSEAATSSQLALVEGKLRNEKRILELQLRSAQASLQDMQQQHATFVAEANRSFRQKLKELTDNLEKRKCEEVRALQDGWNSSIDDLRNKCSLLSEERNSALKRLEETEKSLDAREEAMCSALKERLSVKFYELICEMSNVDLCGPMSSRLATALEGNETIEDQFLAQLSKMSLIKTPRYGGGGHDGERASGLSPKPLLHSTPIKGAPTDPPNV